MSLLVSTAASQSAWNQHKPVCVLVASCILTCASVASGLVLSDQLSTADSTRSSHGNPRLGGPPVPQLSNFILIRQLSCAHHLPWWQHCAVRTNSHLATQSYDIRGISKVLFVLFFNPNTFADCLFSPAPWCSRHVSRPSQPHNLLFDFLSCPLQRWSRISGPFWNEQGDNRVLTGSFIFRFLRFLRIGKYICF